MMIWGADLYRMCSRGQFHKHWKTIVGQHKSLYIIEFSIISWNESSGV